MRRDRSVGPGPGGRRSAALGVAGGLLALLGVLVLLLTRTSVLAHLDGVLEDDLRSLTWRPLLGSPGLGGRLGSQFGEVGDGPTVVSVASLVTVAAALATRRWRPLWASAATLGVLIAAVESGKHVIGRVSPGTTGTDSRLFGAGGQAFPSGHASGTLVVFGLVAALLCGPAGIRPSPWGHRLLTLLALGISGVVGVSTVVVGWHWPSDVVGGWLLGGAVLILGNVLLGRPARPRPRALYRAPEPRPGAGLPAPR